MDLKLIKKRNKLFEKMEKDKEELEKINYKLNEEIANKIFNICEKHNLEIEDFFTILEENLDLLIDDYKKYNDKEKIVEEII